MFLKLSTTDAAETKANITDTQLIAFSLQCNSLCLKRHWYTCWYYFLKSESLCLQQSTMLLQTERTKFLGLLRESRYCCFPRHLLKYSDWSFILTWHSTLALYSKHHFARSVRRPQRPAPICLQSKYKITEIQIVEGLSYHYISQHNSKQNNIYRIIIIQC